MSNDRPRLRLREDRFAWRRVEGELVVLDMQSFHYFTANEAGSVLWNGLAGEPTRDELVDHLTSRFGISRDKAGEDVDAFVADLEARGLLERV